jgi:hypothetical protein
MPRRRDDDEYEDRPRRPSKKKRKSAGPSPVVYVAGGVAFLVFFAIAYFLIQRLTGGSKPGPGGEAVGKMGAPAPHGVKYVPHESEAKFGEYQKANPDKDSFTEAEVYAIMGEPTRREHVFTGVRNGVQMTIYEAHWDVPGSGISSSIDFVNGMSSGMVIGLRTK